VIGAAETATSRSTAYAVFLVVVAIAVLAVVVLGTIFVLVEFGRHP
jgi:hypothetical protein